MAKLIVEAGGATRRFKLGDGKLTLGSGEQATLTLDSQTLAEVHAELEVVGETVTLRVKKGVTPPSVRGRPAQGDVVLKAGVKVKLGDVALSLEGAEPPPVPASAGGQRSRAGSKAGARGAAAAGSSRARVERTRPPSRKASLPSWLIVVFVLAAAGVGVLLVRGGASSLDKEAFSPVASQVRIKAKLAESDFISARKELDKVQRHMSELDPSWRPIFESFRKDVEEAEERATLLARNVKGTPYFQSQLEKFVNSRLKTPNRPAARVLLRRINWFRTQYPLHPQLEWCERMETRWGPVAKLAEPSTFEDMAFEVDSLTWAWPRDYTQAFKVIERFKATSTEGDSTAMEVLVSELEGARQEYFDDRLQEAKHLFGKGSAESRGKAVQQLVVLITMIGNAQMADEAAAILVSLPTVERNLRSYNAYEPDTFKALMTNAIVRRFVEDKGVLTGS
jgi:hypothetical protein